MNFIPTITYSLEESVYEPTYDFIYDWEAIILEDEFLDEDISTDDDDEEEEEVEFIPELWLPGNTEIGEA